jgi:ATP-dependent helicase Lhr and Lhr-like helicase
VIPHRRSGTWALDFVARGGTALQAYPQYNRLRQEEGHYIVTDPLIKRVHRLSIGTILGEVTLQVQYICGNVIGNLQESFIARLKPGHRFTLYAGGQGAGIRSPTGLESVGTGGQRSPC